MSRPARFAKPARQEIAQELDRLSDSPAAMRRFQTALATAARLLVEHPEIGRRDLVLADARYRFWSLRGFPYLLVYRPTARPPLIVRVVHTAQDLPPLLADLRGPAEPEG